MTTTIYYNGNGQPIDVLLERLDTEVLEPDLARGGGYAEPCQNDPAKRIYFGGFFSITHVFHIATDDPDLIARLDSAIARNVATEVYASAKRDRDGQHQAELARYRADVERQERKAGHPRPTTEATQ